MNVFLDIETIPCQLPGFVEQLAAEVTAPATHKKPESIKAWLDENRMAMATEQWLKTSFDGGLGQVVAISWATDDGDSNSICVWDQGDGESSLSAAAEQAMLELFVHQIDELMGHRNYRLPRWVGHNVAEFDLPFLWKRFVVRGLPPPRWLPHHPKPWGEQVYDTMVEWAGARGRISLDRLCKLLGIPGKDGMTGADVWPAVQAGRLAEVAEYCRADVERVRTLYRRLNFV